MDGLAGSQLTGVWRVVDHLDDMNREVRRLLRDLRRLEGPDATQPLAIAATDMEETAADLYRSVSGSDNRTKVGAYLAVIRQQSKETVDFIDALASKIPAGRRLIVSRYERLLAAMDELPNDLYPHRVVSDEQPFADEVLLLSTPQVNTEIYETRIRAMLAKRDTVLIVDGDQVALQGWPDLSVLQRRDSLLALLSLLKQRAHIDVVFDSRVAGREAAAIADGVRVLLTSPKAVPADAVLSLIAAQPLGTPILVVTDDGELVMTTAQMQRAVFSASSISLLRLLVDV